MSERNPRRPHVTDRPQLYGSFEVEFECDQVLAVFLPRSGPNQGESGGPYRTRTCDPLRETLGASWEDIDFDRATLTVRHALPARRKGEGLVLTAPKTAGSRRTLHLPAPVVEALRAHRARQGAERLAMGPSWTDTGLVFTTTIGTPIDPRNFYRSTSALAQRAGLGHWHPHELRHSAASILLAQGVPLEVVSEVLGHASIRMTKDVYGHLIGSQKRDAAEAMSRALWAPKQVGA